jgi:uncharacterized protein (TIGR02145 family)
MKRKLFCLAFISSFIVCISAQNFKTVKLGSQVWMAENLNVISPGSWIYNENADLGRSYGRLYTWDAAKNACPSGWHMPTEQEWQKMIEYVGGEGQAGKQLKPNGNYGFNALLGGFSDIGSYRLMGYYGAYWTASDFDKEHGWYFFITSKDNFITKTYFRKTYGFSVRCVKN